MSTEDAAAVVEPALTLTAINQFRKFLDIMEQFVRDTEAERLAEIRTEHTQHG